MSAVPQRWPNRAASRISARSSGRSRPFIDGAERICDGEGRIGGDFEGEGLGALHQLRGGNNFVDQADAVSLLCVDDGAGEQQLERGPAAHEARQPLRASITGNDAQLHLRLAEARVVGSHAQSAGHGQFAASAEGKSLNAGDDRLAERLNAAQNGLAAQGEDLAFFRLGGGEFANIGARGESAASCPGEQDDANR